jgi:O-6-methylguanine DNA methyltransferase
MHVHVQTVRVPILGTIRLAATSHGLIVLKLVDAGGDLEREVLERFPAATFKSGNAITNDAARALRAYLAGGPDPAAPVVLPELGFTTRVWREIARIPRGTVRSYARVARAIRRPQAARAVGQACGRNPLPLIVPCHRVVASDGSLGGFTAGLEIKRKLLVLEGVTPRP